MKSNKTIHFLICMGVLLFSSNSMAFSSNSVINFTDLISGPKTGIGDGLGEGAIVTIWGQGIGDQQGSALVIFKDSTGVERPAAHVYYWKKADGTLPSGPSNLWASHQMQEIAFSIPSSAANGAGEIYLKDNGTITNSLPFTVRSGDIRHVRSSGVDGGAGNGTYGSPWKTVQYALENMSSPGGTLYIHDVETGGKTTGRAIWWKNTSASSSLAAQFAVVSYPDTRSVAIGQMGVDNYQVEGMVVSKIDIYASNYTQVDGNDQPSGSQIITTPPTTWGIAADRYGRAVANRITDIPGGCASAQQAAITGNALYENNVELFKIFGNEIYDYGCKGTTKFQHTTYMSIRDVYKNYGSEYLVVLPWEFGWNYLHDNLTKNGIHNYDENNIGDSCGNINGIVKIHDNFVVNQAGSGISIGGSCGWSNSWKVYNNVVINAGLANSYNGIDPSTADSPDTGGITVRDSGLPVDIDYYFNTVITWDGDNLSGTTQSGFSFEGLEDLVGVIFDNNLVIGTADKPFFGATTFDGADQKLDNIVGSKNTILIDTDLVPENLVQKTQTSLLNVLDKMSPEVVLFDDADYSRAKLPSWNINTDPNNVTGVTRDIPDRDIYGVLRNKNAVDNGAVENLVRPNPPKGIGLIN